MRHALALGAMLFASLWAAGAQAADHLAGVVLMAPSAGEVVIHHEPFGGMPAMTMTYRVDAQSALRPGDTISADVDRSSEPWSLRNVRREGASAPPAAAVASLLQTGDRVSGTPFIDQRGRPVTLRALRGAPFAVTFIYTRCGDGNMCPLISAKFRALQARLDGRASLVEISLDPAYDRPPVLARYGAAFGADPAHWRILTGDPRTVLDFAARFGILEEAAGAVKIVHSERLAIVDGDGRIVRFFDNAAWSPGDVYRALRAAAVSRGAG